MAGTTPLAYELVPWVRRGLAASISGAATHGYASLAVSVAVNGATTNAPPVRLLGPGDVTGIDPRAIVRTEPRDGTDAFEPNYLAAVDFATPDFPWMCTPSDVANGRLQPWVCLIVLPDGPGVTLAAASGLPDALRIDAPLVPKDELPDLSTIDSWVHAQVTGSGLTAAQIASAFDGDPSLVCARAISARKLAPDTAYIACVVPTYHAGLNAGLGLSVDPGDLAPAWDANVTAPFTIPAYYTFRFRTGPGGDFASLARRIVPVVAAATLGTRDVDFGSPGFGMSAVPSLVLGLEGALALPGTTSAAWPAAQAAYQTALRSALAPPSSGDPVVAPPTYGSAAAGAALPAAGAPPLWLSDLNLDPRRRAVASAGAQVVRDARDALVASAWDQIGDARSANAILGRAQLARAVSSSLVARHLAGTSDGSFFQMTLPLHARIAVTLGGATSTVHGAVAASALPQAATSGALRKLMRPRGPIGRRLPSATFDVVGRLNAPAMSGGTGIAVLAPLAAPKGMVAFDSVEKGVAVAAFALVPLRAASGWNVATIATTTTTPTTTTATTVATHDVVEKLPAAGAAPVVSPAPVVKAAPIELLNDANLPPILKVANVGVPPLITLPTDATQLAAFADRFSAVANVAGTFLDVAQPATTVLAPFGGTAVLANTRATIAARIDPERTVPARVAARLPLGTGRDPLQPVRTEPAYPQAMYAALAELSAEWMLPGIAAVAQDSATLLAPNAAFVESYLIGLNEELARELLWSGFPVDARATYFQDFWAASVPDIPAISAFDPNAHLGGQSTSVASSGVTVLLVRASLFARYPNTVVAAVQAQWSGTVRTLGTTRRYPIFRGSIGSDVTFFGFDVPDLRGSSDPSKNDAGWYFALEEHATEPRFGLEPAPVTTANPTWNDASWSDVSLAGVFLDASKAPATPTREGVAWSASAAALAFILERRPVRVAMHADALLGAAP